jgi:hypothetical protein
VDRLKKKKKSKKMDSSIEEGEDVVRVRRTTRR